MKIGIIGYGSEGQASCRYYLSKDPSSDITILSDSLSSEAKVPSGVKQIIRKDYLSQLDGFDLVIRSSNIPPEVIKCPNQSIVWSATREFVRRCPAPIIGVTGTTGRAITCELIAKILQEHFTDQTGRCIMLLDSLGVEPLDVLSKIVEDDIVVLEITPDQLRDCTKSPSIGVLTNMALICPTGYSDYQEYVRACLNIFYYQHDGNTAVYNQTDPEIAELISHIVTTTQADDMPFPCRSLVHFSDDELLINQEVILPISRLATSEEIDFNCICAAVAATWELTNHDMAAIRRALTV